MQHEGVMSNLCLSPQDKQQPMSRLLYDILINIPWTAHNDRLRF